ncbi:MAG: hypothetical protein Q8S54_15490 [Bacteroidota bacterium]|nr:hypothetical protein [Odoribacter sp.]MDP3644581.1 hypothetical protein [Bacteroidota bacterium]
MTSIKLYLSIMLVIFIITSGCQKKAENLIQYVIPLIGTGPSTGPGGSKYNRITEALGQVTPAVSTPFGMTQWTPQTRDSEKKCVSPYHFSDTKIQGFRGSHWLGGSCTQDYGSFTIMPITVICALLLPTVLPFLCTKKKPLLRPIIRVCFKTTSLLLK